MKRILFVDDEPLLLEVIEARYSGRLDEWELSFAADGEEALKKMFEKPFDVIVADMNMPGMSGIELLTLVMQRHPHTTRIMLSGQADRQKSLQTVGTAHQYISKPCNFEELEAAIDAAIRQRGLLTSEALKKLVSQMQSLPSIPQLYLELVEELQSENPSIVRISDVISRDIGMCTKMLQLVNSAFFGLPRKIANPEEAVSYLGVETVKALVLYLHIFSLYERVKLRGFSFDKLWSHCWSTGVIARKIGQLERVPMVDSDELFITGLLHDVGKLVLVTGLPTQYQEALDLKEREGLSDYVAEMVVFGASHADVGAYLLGQWGLPKGIVEGVAGHHLPASEGAEGICPANVVHVANWLEHQLHGDPGDRSLSLLDVAHLDRHEITSKIDGWREAFLESEPAGRG